jgi:signal transduction histidine kinase
MKPPKHSQSLKFELIFDLSLLTFCALILSEGFLIILLRFELPQDLGDLARSYLRPLHETFVQSKKFDDLVSSQGPIAQKLEPAFEKHSAQWQLGEHWAHVEVELASPDSEFHDGDLIPLKRSFLFVVPTIYEYQYYAAAPRGVGLLRYRWSIVPFQESLTRFKTKAFLMTLFIESILVLLGYWFLFRKNILVPIDHLSRVSKAFLEENWQARSAIERHDELGSVAEALNEMASNIQEKEKKLVLTIESLKRANEEIEARQNEQLQIEKLASIGRLAAGVAHEVGNPLGAISGYVDILRRSMKTKDDSLKDDVELCDRIEAETNRISRIIRALLQQARPAQDRIKAVKVKPVLVRSVQLAQIAPSVDVGFEFEDDEAEVSAEEDQLVQVFLNLLVNAKQAIEMRKDRTTGGQLKIRCHLRKLPFYRGKDSSEYDTSIVRSLKPETYWVVSIDDNGVGIAEQDQKKLFEPFFSTKAVGKGTGLGLYVSKSIVESFRGAIVVRSALNYGTSFSVFLPLAKSYLAEFVAS